MAAWLRGYFLPQRFLDLQNWKGPQMRVVLLRSFTHEKNRDPKSNPIGPKLKSPNFWSDCSFLSLSCLLNEKPLIGSCLAGLGRSLSD